MFKKYFCLITLFCAQIIAAEQHEKHINTEVTIFFASPEKIEFSGTPLSWGREGGLHFETPVGGITVDLGTTIPRRVEISNLNHSFSLDQGETKRIDISKLVPSLNVVDGTQGELVVTAQLNANNDRRLVHNAERVICKFALGSKATHIGFNLKKQDDNRYKLECVSGQIDF